MKLDYKLFLKTVFLSTVLFNAPLPVLADGNISESTQQQAPVIKITGKVLDLQNNPLIGVSVKAPDANAGTITNSDGHYTLTLNKMPSVIVFSYIGYKEATIKYIGKSEINIRLEEDMQLLNEVVVTGYQTISNDRATGSYGILSTKEMDKKISFNGISTIEGKMSGVLVTNTGGIIVRGNSTLSGNIGTDPLLVIDGLPTERKLADINMNDVESITLLKDAAAASIYGVRAANGVLVITTKKGEKGKTIINLTAGLQLTPLQSLSLEHTASTADIINYEEKSFQRGIATTTGGIANYFNTLGGDPSQYAISYYSPYLELQRKLYYGNISQEAFNATVNKWKTYDYRRDFRDQASRDPFFQQYSLSISNSNDRQNTYVSFMYSRNNPSIKTENEEQFKLYMKTNQRITKWLTGDFVMDINYGNSNAVISDLRGGYTNANAVEPYRQILDDNGNRTDMGIAPSAISNTFFFGGSSFMNSRTIDYLTEKEVYPTYLKPYYFNILDELEQNIANTKSIRTRAIASLNANIFKGLTFNTSFSYETASDNLNYVAGENTYGMRYLYNRFVNYNETTKQYTSKIPKGDYLRQQETSSSNYTFRNQFNYNNTFNNDHSITAVAGMELRQTKKDLGIRHDTYGFDQDALSTAYFDNYTIYTTGYPSYIYGPNRLQIINAPSPLFQSPLLSSMNRYVSVYGTAGYTYKDKYSLTGSIRVDQANLFGTDPKYRYRPLWSVGAKWNISKEKFMSDIHWLNLLSVHTSYGLTGNVDQTSSPYILAQTLINSTITTSLPANWISRAPNPLLRWEKTDNYDFGFDFAILKNKLSGKVDVYYKKSSDLLTTNNLDLSSGFITATINNGIMTNKGVEFSLNSIWLEQKDWSLNSSVVFSFNNNKVTNLEKEATTVNELIISRGLSEGYPIQSLYALPYAGLTSGYSDNTLNGFPLVTYADGSNNITIDDKGAMKITSASSALPVNAKYMGSILPTWNGSFTQGVQYKDFDLGVMFTFSGGNKIRKPAIPINLNSSVNGSTSEDISRAWTPDNPNTNIPKMLADYTASQGAGSNPIYLNYAWQYADCNVVSGDMIRLYNLTLSYSLPKKIAGKMSVRNAKISLQGNNLWYWSAAGNDIDPGTVTANDPSRVLPRAASYLMKVDLTF